MKKYTIAEIAQLAGITRRGVRFYVQKGLLPPPAGGGRGHYYTDDHLARLRKIADLQAEGFSLAQIEGILCRGQTPAQTAGEPPSVPPAELWVRLALAPGLELNIQPSLYRLTPGRIKHITEAIQSVLQGKLVPNTEEGE